MQFKYLTNRLILTVGEPAMAPLVLDYLRRNRDDFEKWDMRPRDGYYTEAYQEKALESEQALMLRGMGVRYYMFLKEEPDFIVGNVSFAYLNEEFGHRCSIGYKVDASCRRQGFAYEAASFLIPELAREYGLRRIEADILPENEASIALIKKLGFVYEGMSFKSHEVAGEDRDHMRFSYT